MATADLETKSGDATFALLARMCGAMGASPPPAHQHVDWNLFLELIRHHRVGGLVQQSIEHHSKLAPAWVVEQLHRDCRAQAYRNLAMSAETIRLFSLLDEAEIHAIFFKGITLSQQVYGNALLKQAKDIDFLVRPEDLERCVAILAEEGYRLHMPRTRFSKRQWQVLLRFGIEVEMIHPDTAIQIEPHWAFAENSRLFPADPVRKRAAQHFMEIGGKQVRTLQPDDLFAYLCVHGARSGWHRLKWLADVNAIIRDAEPAHIEHLVRHADSLGVAPCACAALALCARIFDTEIPASILWQVERRWTLRTMVALCHANIADPALPPPSRLTAISLLNAAANGCLMSELRRWAIAPADALAVPLPRALDWLYILARLPVFCIRRARKALAR